MELLKTLPYFIIMKVATGSENPQLKDMAGAIAHIWVFENSEDQAIDKANRYVQAYGCSPEQILSVEMMLPEQVSLLGTQELKNLQAAEGLGINGHFLAWPKTDRPGEYWSESLKKPHKK